MAGKMVFTSDSHFGDEHIVEVERGGKFRDIADHDAYILSLWKRWIEQLGDGDTFYFLGDFCKTGLERIYADAVWRILCPSKCRKVVVFGNHDSPECRELLGGMFDEVYSYPTYLSNRLVVSHLPCATYPGQVNVHGHTHGMDIGDGRHVCASIHVAKYRPITNSEVDRCMHSSGKWCKRFLYEPWAKDYHMTQRRDDVVYDVDGRIDLSASRALAALMRP